MKWKNILLASLVLAACLVYLKLTGSENEEMADPKLLPFQKESIERLSLSWGGEEIVCSKRGVGEWWLEKPVEARASEKEVDGLLRELEDVVVEEGIDLKRAKTSLQDYGLQTPQLNLSLEGNQGTFQLHMGEKDPEESEIYITCEGATGLEELKGQDVLLVKANLLERLQKTAFDLRDKRVARFDKNEIKKLSICGENSSLTCMLDTDNQWHLVDPLETPGDRSRIQSLINDLDKMRVRKFLETTKDFSPYGPVQLQVDLWETEKKTVTRIFVGAPFPKDEGFVQVWREANPWVCLMDASITDTLDASVYDLRKKVVTSFTTDLVERLEIKRGRETLLCERRSQDDNKVWWLTEPLDWKADPNAVEDILFEMETLTASAFVEDEPKDLEPYGLHKPRAKITVTLSEEPATGLPRVQTLLLGKTKVDQEDPTKRQLYAMREGWEPVVLIGNGIQKEVNRPAEEFRDRTVLSFNSWDARALMLTYPERLVELERNENGKWSLLKPISSPANGNQVNDVLYAIDELKALQFVEKDPADLGSYGLDKPRVSLHLVLEDKESESGRIVYELLLGGDKEPEGEKEGGVYALLQSNGWVCVVSPEVAEDLTVNASDLTG